MKPFIFILFCFLIFSFGSRAQQRETPASNHEPYFPPSDSLGGWKTLKNAQEIRQVAGMDEKRLDEAFNFIRTTTKNGGLLVVRHGWLVYERYFGKGQRDATPNLGSCGKSFTSISIGILMNEYPALFPDGLDQKIFTPVYMPAEAFPLADPRMANIKLGQLLSFSAGIRGNNPVYVKGKPSTINPIGPDGWYALVDSFALGLKAEKMYNRVSFSTKTLWCDPGAGYSYATAAAQDASIMLRHVSGMELEDFIEAHLAKPLGWGRWGFGYKNNPLVKHTPGGGGIALRSTDMLRFCYMLLHKGQWNHKQLVPKQYVEKATKASPYNPHYPYSLMFDVNSDGHISGVPRDAYWKAGSGGHCLYVIPSLDLIVWKLGGRDSQYSSKNTGLPEPQPLAHPLPAIDRAKNDHEDKYTDEIKTLKMIIAAITDKKKSNDSALPGQIIADPHHPDKLSYNRDDNGDGQLDPFFLCGPGDPEGFLYRGKRAADGTRDGDQMELIKKLEKSGGNCIYLTAVRTNGGDGAADHKNSPKIYPDELQNPWIGQDPGNGLNDKILHQWEKWFDEMDKHNIVIYFFIYDDGINVGRQFGWDLDKSGNLNPGEKNFIQTLVRRFSRYKNLIWCVMEESQEIGKYWQQHVSKIAEAIRQSDPYDHIISVHQLPGNEFSFKDDPNIDQFAIQTDKDKVGTTRDLHQWLLNAGKLSYHRYSSVMAEDWVEGNQSVPNSNRKQIRQRNWASAMAGVYSMVFGMDISHTPATWLNDCRTLETFFEGTSFNQMESCDSLAGGETEYLLADPKNDYILYSTHADNNLGIKWLPAMVYSLTWMDCITGKKIVIKNRNITSGSHVWKKPANFGQEAVLYIQPQLNNS